MRVLMVMCELLTGGAEVTALRLIRTLQGKGCEFTIAAVRSGGKLTDEFIRTGAKVYEGIARWRFDLLGCFRIARIIRREAINAVIVVDVPRNAMFHGFVGAAISGRRIPRLCWCNSRPDGQSGKFAWMLRVYNAMGLLTAIICTSRLQRRMLVRKGLPRRRTPILRNAVNLDALTDAPRTNLPIPDGKHVIVQVANVTPDKDHDTLLEAVRMLSRSRDDFHLLLVGRGTDSPSMRKRVSEDGLDRFITLAGRRADVPGILARADMFVLSTKREVFSVATLEAMGAGLPVVVSDIPAFDEMFTDGVEGLKVPPGDRRGLADGISKLLDDKQLRERMGRSARVRSERFSVDEMGRSFTRLINHITPTP